MPLVDIRIDDRARARWRDQDHGGARRRVLGIGIVAEAPNGPPARARGLLIIFSTYEIAGRPYPAGQPSRTAALQAHCLSGLARSP